MLLLHQTTSHASLICFIYKFGSQISEAEAASIDQRKKIEELEAQLQEAEDIVSDLRQELGEVHAELDRVKSGNLLQGNETGNTHSREIPVENRFYSYQPNTFLSPNESSVASDMPHHREPSAVYIENRDLPSIILRGKEPGLYRNGCTQRIRACERKLPDRDRCHSEELAKVKGKKGRKQEERKDTFKTPDSEAKAPNELRFQSFLKKRKRAIRRRKFASNHISVEHIAHSDENPSQKGSALPLGKAESLTQLGCAKDSDEERKLVKISGLKTMLKDERVNEQITPLREVPGFSESLCSPDSKMGIEKVDASPHRLESTEELSGQVSRERVIKYTFQRKRKRQALSESEQSGSLEMETKMRDGQSGNQKLEKPNLSSLMESSRESRRLAQVARQVGLRKT